jgi:hypothetical protein
MSESSEKYFLAKVLYWSLVLYPVFGGFRTSTFIECSEINDYEMEQCRVLVEEGILESWTRSTGVIKYLLTEKGVEEATSIMLLVNL